MFQKKQLTLDNEIPFLRNKHIDTPWGLCVVVFGPRRCINRGWVAYYKRENEVGV